ncbi:hypothetical protein [Streptomyces atratus]|uniref:hypothetical protein n=1 Tax=Streptomyces atratus TaxID=1893 RepID=UPI00364B9062
MRTLLTGGTVVSMAPAVGDLDRGDVLLEDGVIVEVAERIDVPDAEVIEAGRPFPRFAEACFSWSGWVRGQLIPVVRSLPDWRSRCVRIRWG